MKIKGWLSVVFLLKNHHVSLPFLRLDIVLKSLIGFFVDLVYEI